MYVCIISSEHLRRCRIISCSEQLTTLPSTTSLKHCYMIVSIISSEHLRRCRIISCSEQLITASLISSLKQCYMIVSIISSEHLRQCRIISCSEKLTIASSTISVKQCHITGTIIKASLGMTGLAPSRLSTYLANRTQIVQGGSSSSCVTFLSFGVPQGSVLGPLLVAVYTSPIAHIAAPYNVCQQQYADDTQLYVAI